MSEVMDKVLGIDFGTTNSLISIILSGKAKSYLNDLRMPHPSVVSYRDGRVIAGRKAKDLLSDNIDNLNDDIVKSPKTMLGKGTFYSNGKEIDPVSVVAELMKFLRHDAQTKEVANVSDFTKAVVSIPVAMDGKARRQLRDAFLQAGIHIVQFVHEPLAALYGYLKDQSDMNDMLSILQGKLALVFDWGGGTLDLTLCQVTEDSVTQIMNMGDNEVGGDYIDEAIRNYVIQQHIEEYAIEENLPVSPGARSCLLQECEKAKIELSREENVLIVVDNYYAVDEDFRDIAIYLGRDELNKICERFINRGLHTITKLLDKLDIDQRRIALCLATGGMVNMPVIKQALLQKFSIDRLELSKKGDRIISEGCAWIANDSLRVALAKNFEIVEARQSYMPIFKRGTLLPKEGDVITEKISMYCVDPRDGKAKFQFVRPRFLNKSAATDDREIYDNLVINVDCEAKPFFERLDLFVTIDDNFIARVVASSTQNGDTDECEIYDLEFSLILPQSDHSKHESNKEDTTTKSESNGKEVGAICSRSNVSSKKDFEPHVPGELLYTYNKLMFDRRLEQATKMQFSEKTYYQPCSICYKIKCECRKSDNHIRATSTSKTINKGNTQYLK